MATDFPDLESGSEGDYVLLVQQMLRGVGFSPGTLGGVFDANTEASVRAFQQAMDLPITGTVDKAFWATIAQLPALGAATPLLERNPQNPYQRHLRSDYHPSPEPVDAPGVPSDQQGPSKDGAQ